MTYCVRLIATTFLFLFILVCEYPVVAQYAPEKADPMPQTSNTYSTLRGTALAFDGVNDYVEIAHNSLVGFTASSVFTIELWIRPSNNHYGNIFDKATRTGGMFNIWCTVDTDGKVYFRINREGQLWNTASSTSTLTPGQWMHVTFRKTGARTMSVAINGVTEGTATAASHLDGATTSTAPISFGRFRRDNAAYFQGAMDEIRIWNVVRTDLEVLQDMTKTTVSTDNPPGLVAYYQFNDGSGTVLDEKVNNLDGTLNNFALSGTASNWISSAIPINQFATYSFVLTGTEGWRFLSVPVGDATVNTLFQNQWTQGFTGSNHPQGPPNVFTWAVSDTGNAATNWRAVTSASQTLVPGQGVAAYLYRDGDGPGTGSSGSFPKTVTVTGMEPSASQNLSTRLNPNVKGWSLLGNPFANSVDWDLFTRSGLSASVYMWNHNSSQWLAWNGTAGGLTNGLLAPFNGFFVYTSTASPALTIPLTARTTGSASFRGKEESSPVFALELRDTTGRTNKAWFSFQPSALTGLDDADAFKLAPFSSEFVEIASVLPGGRLLDINNLPSPSAPVKIPVSVRLIPGASATISVTDQLETSSWMFKLEDHVASTLVDLDRPYRFEAGASKAVVSDGFPEGLQTDAARSRFTLHLIPGSVLPARTEVPVGFHLYQNYPNPFNPTTTIRYTLDKPMQVRLEVIDLNGRIMTVLVDGRQAAGTREVAFNAAKLASGVYFCRLSGLGQERIIKLTLHK